MNLTTQRNGAPDRTTPHRFEGFFSKRAVLIWWLLLFQILLLAYLPSINGPFVYDDIPSIVDNPDSRPHRRRSPTYQTAQAWEMEVQAKELLIKNREIWRIPEAEHLQTLEYLDWLMNNKSLFR